MGASSPGGAARSAGTSGCSSGSGAATTSSSGGLPVGVALRTAQGASGAAWGATLTRAAGPLLNVRSLSLPSPVWSGPAAGAGGKGRSWSRTTRQSRDPAGPESNRPALCTPELNAAIFLRPVEAFEKPEGLMHRAHPWLEDSMRPRAEDHRAQTGQGGLCRVRERQTLRQPLRGPCAGPEPGWRS